MKTFIKLIDFYSRLMGLACIIMILVINIYSTSGNGYMLIKTNDYGEMIPELIVYSISIAVCTVSLIHSVAKDE